MREEIVFGPIHSRRLGSSLGINLLPEKGKLCNFDCVYCECGWNKDGRNDKKIPSAVRLRKALTAKLEECSAKGIAIDSITFSGDGEPTLNPAFPEIIDITIELRDKYFPKAVVSVLTNATRIGIPSVFEALRKVDNPILKLDAPTDELAARINQPQGNYHVADVVESMRKLEGDFVLQTMFLRSSDFDSSSPEVLQGGHGLHFGQGGSGRRLGEVHRGRDGVFDETACRRWTQGPDQRLRISNLNHRYNGFVIKEIWLRS